MPIITAKNAAPSKTLSSTAELQSPDRSDFDSSIYEINRRLSIMESALQSIKTTQLTSSLDLDIFKDRVIKQLQVYQNEFVRLHHGLATSKKTQVAAMAELNGKISDACLDIQNTHKSISQQIQSMNDVFSGQLTEIVNFLKSDSDAKKGEEEQKRIDSLRKEEERSSSRKKSSASKLAGHHSKHHSKSSWFS